MYNMGVESISTQQPLEIKSANSHVSLKQYTIGDAQDIFALIDRNRPHLSQFTDKTSFKYKTLEDVEKSILKPKPKDKNKLRFTIRNEDNVLVGTVNLKPDSHKKDKAEIGYYIGKEFTYTLTGKNYIDEAVKLLTDFAFKNMGLNEIVAVVDQGNVASEKVLRRCGFDIKENDQESITYNLLNPNR